MDVMDRLRGREVEPVLKKKWKEKKEVKEIFWGDLVVLNGDACFESLTGLQKSQRIFPIS